MGFCTRCRISKPTFALPAHEQTDILVGEALRRGGQLVSVVPRRESLESMFVEKFTTETAPVEEGP